MKDKKHVTETKLKKVNEALDFSGMSSAVADKGCQLQLVFRFLNVSCWFIEVRRAPGVRQTSAV